MTRVVLRSVGKIFCIAADFCEFGGAARTRVTVPPNSVSVSGTIVTFGFRRLPKALWTKAGCEVSHERWASGRRQVFGHLETHGEVIAAGQLRWGPQIDSLELARRD